MEIMDNTKIGKEKERDHQMKGTHKHTEVSLIRFDNHRCLSRSEERKIFEHMVKTAPHDSLG